MQIDEKYKSLIEDIIKESELYPSYEALFDEFCSELYKKTYLVLNSKKSFEEAENYLLKFRNDVMQRVISKYFENNSFELMFEDFSLNTFEITKKQAEKILKAVYEFGQKNPRFSYYQIFYMRFFENKSQAEIASSIGISQGELSKRFIEIADFLTEKKIAY